MCWNAPGFYGSILWAAEKIELEAAFLHRCSGLYLMNGEKMDRYIITDIGRVAARGEPLSDMCRLAFLEYFARNRDERGERV